MSQGLVNPSLPAGVNNIGDVDVLTINGQAPAYGTGVRGATVPRVTISTDDVVVISNTDITAINGKFTAATALPDNHAVPTTTEVGAILQAYNGIGNIEKLRTTTSSLNVLSSGILAAGMIAQFNDTTPTAITEAQFGNVRMSGNRNLYMRIRDNAGNERGLNIDANGELGIGAIRSALPVGDNNIGNVDVLTVNGQAPAFGTGVRGATVQRVTIATDDSLPVTNAGVFVVQVDGAALTALQLIDDTVFTDDAVFTPATSKISSVGFFADETATDSVDEGDIGAARMTLDRKQITAVYAHTAGGYTPGKIISAASTNATLVKSSPGTVGYITVGSVNAAPRYLKLYNQTTSPTVGTDVPVQTYIIPGNTAGAGSNIPLPDQGIALTVGIAWAITVEATDAGSTGVALNEITVNYGWK